MTTTDPDLRQAEAPADTAPEELATVLDAAASATAQAGVADGRQARWLEAIADVLEAHRTELVALADAESHLGPARLGGELTRTVRQLAMFAAVVREGAHLEAIIDHADATASPPAPDLRRMLVPVGPVAVFAASNFPFAFSVAGGDTAAALAAGCPVVVKAHPAHPRLSDRVCALAAAALDAAGAPAGLLQVVHGTAAGRSLVLAPAVRAVGFTGSTHGGRALFDLACSRADPIPFHGELGSINPVVITAAALERRGDDLAAGLVASYTLGVGQYCTKPGVVFVPTAAGFGDRVLARLGHDPARMLTPHIAGAFAVTRADLAAHPQVTTLVDGTVQGDEAQASLFATTAAAVAADPDALFAEVFGPATLLVHYDGDADLSAAIAAVPGSLTATIHAEPDDDVHGLAARLAAVSGRVLFGGWPTGVAVNWSQQHGGPWPATTSQFTSVGATSVRRFQRPVAWQDAPEAYLPAALRDDNPLGIARRVDGVARPAPATAPGAPA